MQSVSDPLNRFFEDGSWFARAHELRLWVVRYDASLRNPLLAMLPKLEFHADNRSAWPLLPDAHTREDDRWQLRANGLAADWGRRVEAFAAEGVEQGPIEGIEDPRGLARLSIDDGRHPQRHDRAPRGPSRRARPVDRRQRVDIRVRLDRARRRSHAGSLPLGRDARPRRGSTAGLARRPGP